MDTLTLTRTIADARKEILKSRDPRFVSFSGKALKTEMRREKTTLRAVAARMNVTLKSIRARRDSESAYMHYLDFCDVYQGVSGVNVFMRQNWDRMVEEARQLGLPESPDYRD